MFENFKKRFTKVSWFTIVDDFIDMIKEFSIDETSAEEFGKLYEQRMKEGKTLLK